MAYLALVRHGMSAYNEKGLWTGWADPELVDKGIEQAKTAGASLRDITFDLAYTSALKRAHQTLDEIKRVLEKNDLPTAASEALNERNYGDYTGKNKWEVQKLVGEEEFQKIRRGWDHAIPNGESLKQVFEREIPYFEAEILPLLKSGKNVLLVSSGNAIRAIIKFLEHVPDNEISKFELGVGEVVLYTIDESGKIMSKEHRNTPEVHV